MVIPYMSCEYTAIQVSISAEEQLVLRQVISSLVDLILAWLFCIPQCTKPKQKMAPKPKQGKKNQRSGMGVAFLLNNRPFPERSKPGKTRQCKSNFRVTEVEDRKICQPAMSK